MASKKPETIDRKFTDLDVSEINKRGMIFAVGLRPYNGDIITEVVATMSEVANNAMWFNLRCRFCPELALGWYRFPPRTTRDQAFKALDKLTHEERRKLYKKFQGLNT